MNLVTLVTNPDKELKDALFFALRYTLLKYNLTSY